MVTSYINSLMSDPYGYEVAWDFCLEQGIILPGDGAICDQTVSDSGAQAKEYSVARPEGLGISCSGTRGKGRSSTSRMKSCSGMVSRHTAFHGGPLW